MVRFALGLFSLTLCTAQAQTIVDETGKGIPKERLDFMMKSVSDRFPDPESSKFRAIVAGKSNYILCGEVNSKNMYGAYSGYKLFIDNYDGMPMVETIDVGFDRELMLKLSKSCGMK